MHIRTVRIVNAKVSSASQCSKKASSYRFSVFQRAYPCRFEWCICGASTRVDARQHARDARECELPPRSLGCNISQLHHLSKARSRSNAQRLDDERMTMKFKKTKENERSENEQTRETRCRRRSAEWRRPCAVTRPCSWGSTGHRRPRSCSTRCEGRSWSPR